MIVQALPFRARDAPAAQRGRITGREAPPEGAEPEGHGARTDAAAMTTTALRPAVTAAIAQVLDHRCHRGPGRGECWARTCGETLWLPEPRGLEDVDRALVARGIVLDWASVPFEQRGPQPASRLRLRPWWVRWSRR